MTRSRKRFIQLWARQCENGVRLPTAFYFIRGDHDDWRCFYGPVGKVRRSRVFINRSAIYGFVSAKELLYTGTGPDTNAGQPGNNRFIRCRIINRIKRPAFVPETRPAINEVPAAATDKIAAEASGGDAVSLL
ncbi:MAG: hypothetical protein NTZ09_07135 [Candidatus Hydrogenedentes bacterium]|nr:hypothetical protein [Candidatus Hydrogenedentota bacterium]